MTPWISRHFYWLLAVFPVYQAWDLWALYITTGVDYHLIVESFASAAFVWILVMVARDRSRVAREMAALATSASTAQRALVERDARARASTRDFLEVIREQFEAWKLTGAEKDVALLLVKGLSLDEIAAVRESRPKTVRQHATAVYAKGGFDGRHQLAAYFLEDLLAPPLSNPGVAPHGTTARMPAGAGLALTPNTN